MNKINVYSWFLVLRVLAILFVCIALGLVFLNSDWIFTQIILISLIVMLTLELNVFLHKTNSDLTTLINVLRYKDYNTTLYKAGKKKRYIPLIHLMEDIKKQYQSGFNEGQKAQYLYSKAMNSVDEGVIVFDTDTGQAVMRNSKAMELLQVPVLKDLNDLEHIAKSLTNRIKDAGKIATISIDQAEFKHYIGQALRCKIEKFTHQKNHHTLLVIQNAQNAVSGEEFETWVNFGKVISHEILNGISPLVSLTNTLQEQLTKIEGNERLIESMNKATALLQERCYSLQSYSEKYRTLNRLPEPKKEILQWSKVLERTEKDFKETLSNKNIELNIGGDAIDESFNADSWQIDQVFTNLIQNSIHALDAVDIDKKVITIDVSSSGMYQLIKFADNGIGIDPNSRANVFVPFFTTRESGSGIGLSVVKQILFKHDAEIYLGNQDGYTSFIIKFPKIS